MAAGGVARGVHADDDARHLADCGRPARHVPLRVTLLHFSFVDPIFFAVVVDLATF